MEIENIDVAFAAIRARMRAKKLDETAAIRSDRGGAVAPKTQDLGWTKGLIALRVVLGEAVRAPRLHTI
jgi:hypothetical protein